MAAAEMDDDYKADISSLLEVNRLDYRLPPSLSIATSRAEKHYPGLNQTVQMGNPIIFTLSSGASYIDVLNSYISFYVQFSGLDATTAAAVRMSSHVGWANMFQKYIVIHSSGVELDRQNDAVGEWVQIQNYYNRSKDRRRIQGSLYGLNDCPYPGGVLRDTNQAFAEAFDQQGVLQIGAAAASTVNTFPNGTAAAAGGGQKNQLWNQKYDFQGAAASPLGGFYENRRVDNSTGGGLTPGPTQAIQVTIPLSQIAGIFDVDLLAPSFLCAGLRLELYTYPKEHFFELLGPLLTAADPVGTAPAGQLTGSGRPIGMPNASITWPAAAVVNIVQPTINVESFTLTDSIVRKLSQISSQSGLEWYWDAIHQTSVSTGQSSGSIQISRALSRANSCVLKTRLATDVGAAAYDSYASLPWDLLGVAATAALNVNADVDGTLVAYQVQLGAQYIPALPIQTTPQYLHSALKTFNQFRRSDELSGPPLWDFRGLLTIISNTDSIYDTYYGPLAIAAVPLESSSTLQQSGAAISAQRTAVVNYEFARAPITANTLRRVDLFVPYSKLATLFLDSVVVRS